MLIPGYSCQSSSIMISEFLVDIIDLLLCFKGLKKPRVLIPSAPLARKEGLFVGTSSGGNVHAALRIAKKLGPTAKVVTLMIDSGLKYLSTDLYRRIQ
jgi:hypothetical protein